MHHGGSGASRTGSGTPVQIQQSVLSLPARWKGNQPAGAGLSNLGNSCYLNSTLQCLAYVPPLAHICLGRTHSSSCPRGSSSPGSGSTRPGGTLGGLASAAQAPCTFCIIERQLSAQLRGTRGVAVSPTEVVRNLHHFSRSFVRGRQEDSHELLTAVLDVMERDGTRAALALGAPKGCRTIVEELFLGRWQSQVRCLVCGHESNTYESFTTLPLDIAQARSVAEGLRAFTEAERLDGNNKYKCDKCSQLVPAIKQTTIWDDPNVLVLHLKRFDAGSLLGKITRHVAFAETVDLQPFMTPPAARRRAEQQHQQQQQAAAAASNGHHHHHHHRHDQHHHGQENGHGHHGQHQHDKAHANGHLGRDSLDGSQHQHEEQQELELAKMGGDGACADGGRGHSIYTLTGVLVHQGTSLHSGHYYAFVRDSYGGWSCMNDSHVYGTSLEQVRQEQAYLLFYTRQSMKLPRPALMPPPAVAAEGPAPPVRAAPGASDAGPARQVYGPQLPLNMTRGASANGSTVPPGGSREGPLPLRPSRLNLPIVPSACLPAKIVVLPKAVPAAAAPTAAAAEANGVTTAQPLANGRVPSGDLLAHKSSAGGAGAPLTAAAADVAARVGDGAPEARKRKRESDGGSGGGAAVAPVPVDEDAAARRVDGDFPAASDGTLSAVEREVAALKACASWSDGIKRLRLTVEERLRGSSLPRVMREVVLSLQRSGLSLEQVLKIGSGDPRRKALHREIPQGVLQYGTDELRKLLRPLLMLLGWLGGPMPVMLL